MPRVELDFRICRGKLLLDGGKSAIKSLIIPICCCLSCLCFPIINSTVFALKKKSAVITTKTRTTTNKTVGWVSIVGRKEGRRTNKSWPKSEKNRGADGIFSPKNMFSRHTSTSILSAYMHAFMQQGHFGGHFFRPPVHYCLFLLLPFS